ncbi:putative entry exclusion protein TrbK-alt [Mesorhizobium sp. WSM3626]|uniref:putative entry exclusion protein TrbK-alt n=1 Tax=Mesorhizobium sp. WSM3626 TaxID=1040987 RepID=UPI0004B9D2C1|nr:putative entry exclusion protein TrbK-alt [Mesorhizobium sp. WSM3626]
MDFKTTARLIGVTALALAVAITIISRNDDKYTAPPILRPADPDSGPLVRELTRCRTLGEQATHDVACKAAWEESRRRFFMPGNHDRPAWPADDRFGRIDRSLGEDKTP